MMDNQKTFFPVDDRLRAVSDAAEREAAGVFSAIDETAAYNQEKVLAAFIRHRVDEACFAATTGYGYGDKGRETLDKILADVMGAEDALIRHSILSGTHAITIALFAMLRPGDTMLAATGAPFCIPWQNAISAAGSRSSTVWMMSPRTSSGQGETS